MQKVKIVPMETPDCDITVRKLFIEDRCFGRAYGSDIDPKAFQELGELTNRRGFKFSIALPDLHAGNGIPVGHVTKFSNYVHYDIIGPDVGCHVRVMQLNKRISSTIIERVAYYVEENSFGTEFPSIGGGNHFFDISIDHKGNQYFIMHTGSRGVGGDFYKSMKHELSLMESDLVHIDSKLFKILHQEFETAEGIADWNSYTMMIDLARQFSIDFTINIMTKHNTIVQKGREVLHYKGASYVEPGTLVGIPLNMQDGTLIVEAQPAIKDLFCAINHGAGRKMSRSEARNTLTEDNLAGINVISKRDIRDEAPAAYKDIMSDMEAMERAGYIKILRKLTPLITVKR